MLMFTLTHRCAPESLRRQEFSSSSDVWMFAVTVWEIFTLCIEDPWFGLSVPEILNALEELGERLRCPELCPPSTYSLLLLCWSLNPNDRPKFSKINSRLNQSRPIQYRVTRDNKQINQLTLLRGDTISVFDSYVDKPIWKGQNHRTQKVGLFPRICLSSTTTNTNEKISWPVRGSFIHTGHSDGTGQGSSWGKIDKIDETILSNPIITPINRNERHDNVQIVSNVLQLNGSMKDKPIITRAPPPIPRSLPTITGDLPLIDLSDSRPEKTSDKSNQNNSSERFITNHQQPIIDSSHSCSSSYSRQRFSNNLTDSQKFVEKVVTGVTEQLKNDFPKLNSMKTEFTPPVVRRFTIPYPPPNQSSYYNVQRQA
ncbi:unnamed protein product [Rotaria magnacalcarata]|uniref:non-specific protein-tyrosine kinase n=3 Tax=Rotaria magnacalcarata TaxID=392030 RepID=A0A815U7J8_9BILA|nr:unnamed protein product [Rotaria magnacalcarata]